MACEHDEPQGHPDTDHVCLYCVFERIETLEARLKEATEIIRHADRVIGPLSRPDEVEAWERAARPFLDRQV